MNVIADHVTLEGVLEEISIQDFRRSPGAVFQMVALGKTFVILRNGNACAVLSKPPANLTIVIKADGSTGYAL